MKNNSKQLNKKKSRFPSWLIFLIGGFLAGLLSLILSVFSDLILEGFYFWSKTGILFVIFLVAIEELVKLGLINFLFARRTRVNFQVILNGLFFGFGFGLFEFILISQKSPTLTSIFLLFIVHSLTSILIITAVIGLKNKKNIFIFYFLLAFFLHLIYNLFIIY